MSSAYFLSRLVEYFLLTGASKLFLFANDTLVYLIWCAIKGLSGPFLEHRLTR